MGMNRIYIGFDPAEERSYDVCLRSIYHRTRDPGFDVVPLDQTALRRAGLYRRASKDGKDWMDGKPFSSEFSFTRFLIPAVNLYRGWALFCDADMMFRDDLNKLFDLADPEYAVMCVFHNQTESGVKKIGAIQESYQRKNWSSLVLWNCAHPAHNNLTVDDVSLKPGSWLHGFRWLLDSKIGELPVEWNWLEGISDPKINPKNVHFTRGAPWMPGYENSAYADEWRKYEL